MKILIVEDERKTLDRLLRLVNKLLSNHLSYCEGVESLAAANCVLVDTTIDVVILDLNLSGEDGFNLLREWSAKSFHTIIVSAKRDKALDAFELGVVDFVPKPFEEARLKLALDRCVSRLDRPQPTKWISCHSVRGVEMVAVSAIQSISADGGYSQLRLKIGEKRLCDKSLDKLEVILPQDFIRIHRSHIVNIAFVKHIRSSTGTRYYCDLESNTSLPIGRTRIANIRRLLNIS